MKPIMAKIKAKKDYSTVDPDKEVRNFSINRTIKKDKVSRGDNQKT